MQNHGQIFNCTVKETSWIGILALVNIQKLVILWIKDKKKCYVIG